MDKRFLEERTLIKNNTDFQSIQGVDTCFPVIVDYARTFEQLMDSGNYDWVDPIINEQTFKVESHNPKLEQLSINYNAFVVSFPQELGKEEIILKLNVQKLRLATTKELLAFGEQYPDQQLQYYIFALGSEGLGEKGYIVTPNIGNYEGRRNLCVQYNFKRKWESGTRFLVIREL